MLDGCGSYVKSDANAGMVREGWPVVETSWRDPWRSRSSALQAKIVGRGQFIVICRKRLSGGAVASADASSEHKRPRLKEMATPPFAVEKSALGSRAMTHGLAAIVAAKIPGFLSSPCSRWRLFVRRPAARMLVQWFVRAIYVFTCQGVPRGSLA